MCANVLRKIYRTRDDCAEDVPAAINLSARRDRVVIQYNAAFPYKMREQMFRRASREREDGDKIAEDPVDSFVRRDDTATRYNHFLGLASLHDRCALEIRRRLCFQQEKRPITGPPPFSPRRPPFPLKATSARNETLLCSIGKSLFHLPSDGIINRDFTFFSSSSLIDGRVFPVRFPCCASLALKSEPRGRKRDIPFRNFHNESLLIFEQYLE